jgi:hypothetical protein
VATKKSMWFFLTVLIFAAFLLGSATQVIAETWKFKASNHVTKVEMRPIPDAEGHWVGFQEREGVTIYETGELAWHKVVVIFDGIKGVGGYSQYITVTFQDGSTMTNYCQGKSFPGGYKWTAEIINGTGRFKGAKGTVTSEGKSLPPEKGEIIGKAVGEGTTTFTLPPK